MKISLTRYGFQQKNDEPEVDENSPAVQKLVDIVRTFKKSDKYCRKHTSYRFKHVLENYLAGITNREITYVGNGEFIKAMMIAGFEWKISSPNSPNAIFKISMDSFKGLEEYFKCV